MEPIEIAPGIDIKKEILAHMAFLPVIKGEPRLMDARIFKPEPMGLKDHLLTLRMEDRLLFHSEAIHR